MKNKSRSKSRLNSSNPAVNTVPVLPEAAIWLGSTAATRLADDLHAVLENRASPEQLTELSGFVTTLRNMTAMEAMRNAPAQGWMPN